MFCQLSLVASTVLSLPSACLVLWTLCLPSLALYHLRRWLGVKHQRSIYLCSLSSHYEQQLRLLLFVVKRRRKEKSDCRTNLKDEEKKPSLDHDRQVLVRHMFSSPNQHFSSKSVFSPSFFVSMPHHILGPVWTEYRAVNSTLKSRALLSVTRMCELVVFSGYTILYWGEVKKHTEKTAFFSVFMPRLFARAALD